MPENLAFSEVEDINIETILFLLKAKSIFTIQRAANTLKTGVDQGLSFKDSWN